MNRFVSVIVATRNRRALLERTLHAVLAQRWPADRYEVIVADNGSTDETEGLVGDLARRYPAVAIAYLYVPEPGKSRAVNEALAVARGNVLAFLDDDVRPEANWLSELARAFDDDRIDFVAGRIFPDWEMTPPSWLSPPLYGVLAVPDGGPARRPIDSSGSIMPLGANMAVRAAVVRRIGGLRPDLGKLEGTLRTGEDHEFFLRLLHSGSRGIYEPAVLVTHRVPSERLRRGYFRRWMFQNGRDVARLERAYSRGVPRLLGLPRYLWPSVISETLVAVRAAFRGNKAGQFCAASRLIWKAGYLIEAWSGR